ncbi:flagellin N-terminal helical domain-containing protein [Shinella zoogloeoides]|uniref:flagellin N-terminal helical domain-containing protein n=1 Tax=Shinella zoogloeoides TaxID=352475 RepID=UPI00273D6B86|nr:flagellin [Shinella zoogloeoides]WLR93132.1 flagellin [Shinella zoogloeoides]
MTSILTNNAAMAALQTLRSIGSGMEETQARVSSGLRVGEAADNAAYWSIATTMRSDNGALSAVQDALGLGAAKVDTAYAGLESSIEVVKEIKNKLVAAREAGVDRTKIQQEIEQLQGQLKSIASSASFSGENWLQASVSTPNATAGDVADAATVTKQVVGSFTRDSSGNVKVQSIDVELTSSNVLFDTSGNKMAILDQEALRANVAKVDGVYYDAVDSSVVDSTYAESANGVWTDAANTAFYIKADENKWVEVTDATGAPITAGTQTAIASVFADGTSVTELDISDLGTAKTNLGLAATASDEEVIDLLISHVDRQLEAATGAAADMGSVAMRLDLQEDFVNKLSDSIDSGIGRLVDADMNEESTRLKALQTQQQLGIQSLSIANSASENILTLFR